MGAYTEVQNALDSSWPTVHNDLASAASLKLSMTLPDASATASWVSSKPALESTMQKSWWKDGSGCTSVSPASNSTARNLIRLMIGRARKGPIS